MAEEGHKFKMRFPYIREHYGPIEELISMEIRGCYEDFLELYAELSAEYKDDPAKLEELEREMLDPSCLHFIMLHGEKRDPEDTVKIVRYLIAKGIDTKYVDGKMKKNNLAMFYRYGCTNWPPEWIYEMTKLLVENGVDPGQEDKYGNPTVDMLLMQSECLASELEPTIAYLVEHGARFGGGSKSGFYYVEDGWTGEREEAARRMREKYETAKKWVYQLGELACVAEEGPYEEFLELYKAAVEEYKDEPAQLEKIEKDILGPECLYSVLRYGERRDLEDARKMIEYLFGKGIDPKYQDSKTGKSYLEVFYRYNCKKWPPEWIYETTKLLVEKGVDAGQENKAGTPLVDEMIYRSPRLASELEPTIVYLVEHGARFGGRNKRGVSLIEDKMSGEKQEEARRMREKYGNEKEE